MKQVVFKKKSDPKKRTKLISIHQITEDSESRTDVQKYFSYLVTQSHQQDEEIKAPEIFITKSADSKLKIEKFTFQVRGSFMMTHNRVPLKVRFQHTLHIHIQWKTKAFSPKKSAVLTK